MRPRGRTLRRSILTAACAVLLVPPSAGAAQRSEDPVQYRALVDSYRGKNQSGAVDAVLGWNEHHVAAILLRLSKAESPTWTAPEYKAGAMLHTDVALRLLDDATPASTQLDFALQLLKVGIDRRVPGLDEFASRWRLAVSRVLRDRRRPHLAEFFLARTRTLLPDDAIVLFESGAVAEELATEYAFEIDVAMTTGMERRTVENLVSRATERRNQHLADAVQWFTRSAAMQPVEEARLHLARAQMLTGNDVEALRLLAPLESSSDLSTGYIAALFTAAIHERAGKLDDASAAYKRALERHPRGHAATIGSSAVQQRTGKGDASRETLETLFARTSAPDPWWWYQYEAVGVADERLDAIRVEARQ